MPIVSKTKAILFYGNYFYGICAVVLSAEASLQQGIPLADMWYFSCVFFATVYFYSIAYTSEKSPIPHNPRSAWYQSHKLMVQITQLVMFTYLMGCGVFFIKQYLVTLLVSPTIYLTALIFPVTGAFYYGLDMERLKNFNLRKMGLVKPFIIGFVWAGIVTVYPVLFDNLEHHLPFYPTLFGNLLFLKNLMFIGLLCIMFDIKDHVTDSSLHLNTFIVRSGLRTTIFFILIPLCVLGFGTFITYSLTHHFSPMKIIINSIPFIALGMVAYSLRKRRPLMYYLTIVDGLMLLKAICGILAFLCF